MGEDWLAVVLGFGLIAAVLAGVRPQLPVTGWSGVTDLAGTVFGSGNLLRLAILGAGVVLLASVAAAALGAAVPRFLTGAVVLFGLAWLAQVAAGHSVVRFWGLEYVIFALALGLIISNLIGVPAWLAEAARAEFYIKIGLVILGASVLFGDLVQAGFLGIGQGLLVVLVVWFFSFRLAKRLRVDDELAVMLSTAVSICGVSAAIAACGAIQGDRKKLSYVTSLVLIVAVPMMVLMPRLVSSFGIPEVVGGAWLGGTLDTSASVVAAGEMISPAARDAGVVVKLSQNVLIGAAAFLLTVWWTVRRNETVAAPGAKVIWERFPKFVLGFLAVSFLFSFVLPGTLVAATRAPLNALRTTWFALAFTSIGLETRFHDLVGAHEGQPGLAFVGAQAFNVIWTLLLAYIFFGGMLFPAPTFQ
jgi:uncharacterized integral membrane protein (TIGR00698 family)